MEQGSPEHKKNKSDEICEISEIDKVVVQANMKMLLVGKKKPT